MKNKKLLRYLIIITVVLIILAIIGKKSGWFGEDIIYKVSVEKVQKRTIIETITANGKIQPETEVKISPDVSGEIVDLYVKEGNEVKKGDLLFKIKPEIYISALERMNATVNSSKAQLQQAEASFSDKEKTFDRSKSLWEKKAISDAEYEASLAAYKMAKASLDASKYSVKSAEASLKETEENLIKTSVYAPMDGTISKLNVEKGERVVGTEMMTGTEVLRVADLEKMEVLVEVNENDIVRVNLGDTAIIEVDAYMDHKFKGVVTEIANSANTSGIATDQVTNFNVKISILHSSYEELIPKDNPKFYPFRPGMSATVDIRTQTVFNVLSVLIPAVTTRTDSSSTKAGYVKDNNNQEPEEGSDEEEIVEKKTKKTDKEKDNLREVVFVYDEKGKKVKMVDVKTGIQDNDYIEIRKGLKEGEEVVIAPYSAISKKLKHDMQVQKEKKEDLLKEKETE